MSGRRTLGVSLAVLVALAGVAAALWIPIRPRASVAMPTPRTTPDAVVRTYVQALDGRDFSTSNALQPYGNNNHWWTLSPPRITNLRITHTGHVEPGSQLGVAGSGRWKQGVEVDTTAILHNWSGMDNGPAPWGYYLVRGNNKQPWRILDWGQG